MHAVPEGSKVSRYETYKQVEKSAGKTPPGLIGPSLPWQCEPAWFVFVDLNQVSYTEIKSYMDVTGENLDLWEIDLIITFDRLRRVEPKWQNSQS